RRPPNATEVRRLQVGLDPSHVRVPPQRVSESIHVQAQFARVRQQVVRTKRLLPRQSLLPLFPGYFPFVAREDHQRRLLETGRVAQIMEIPDQRRFVDDLLQIWKTLESGTAILGVESITPGQTVRIQEGPLAGMTGIVKEVRDQRSLLLAVEAFQMAVCVQIGRLAVEVIQ
ncbi:MAG TPA: hypothetical protein PK360_17150, partial [bacterium]|nr:hypothetical protein [bacterium]